MAKLEDNYQSLVLEACNGNEAGFAFLALWNQYVHAIDDIVDGQATPETTITTFACAANVFSHPFYLANRAALYAVVMLVANAYADSVSWEKSDRDGQRTMSDVLRFAGNEMLFAVALICGGYAHLRKISPVVRERSWLDHHNDKGERE
jgi:hypothetical protein